MSSLSQGDRGGSRAHADSFGMGKGWKVVIAEDESADRRSEPAELLRRALIHLGHVVVGVAQNGAEAVALARERQPDVVVMDLRMPVMEGWTALAELTRTALAPVVVVSALEDREALERALAAGASAFLTKPVREDDLTRALELAVARFADLSEIRRLRAEAEERALGLARQTAELERVVQELRAAQVQLVNAARRAAIAGLAHGLAHEINNALTPIVGNAQILTLLHRGERETVQRANQIIEHAQRIAGWTASFREVTLGGSRQSMPFSFNELVRDVLGLYADRFRRLGITATAELDESLLVMQGHPDQVREVLMSLIQNAVEAMRSGGTLRVQTRYLPDQVAVETRLTDSGIGIAPEHLPHVFEPGFTTKATDQHSVALGWGLFTAQEILRAHGGTIRIFSPPPHASSGTVVEWVLPLGATAAS